MSGEVKPLSTRQIEAVRLYAEGEDFTESCKIAGCDRQTLQAIKNNHNGRGHTFWDEFRKWADRFHESRHHEALKSTLGDFDAEDGKIRTLAVANYYERLRHIERRQLDNELGNAKRRLSDLEKRKLEAEAKIRELQALRLEAEVGMIEANRQGGVIEIPALADSLDLQLPPVDLEA